MRLDRSDSWNRGARSLDIKHMSGGRGRTLPVTTRSPRLGRSIIIHYVLHALAARPRSLLRFLVLLEFLVLE